MFVCTHMCVCECVCGDGRHVPTTLYIHIYVIGALPLTCVVEFGLVKVSERVPHKDFDVGNRVRCHQTPRAPLEIGVALHVSGLLGWYIGGVVFRRSGTGKMGAPMG